MINFGGGKIQKSEEMALIQLTHTTLR